MTFCAALSIFALGFLQVRPLEVSGEAGFGGLYKPGAWTPVVLDLHNPGDARELLIILCWAAPRDRQSANPSPDSLERRSGPFHHFPLAVPKDTRRRFHATIPAPGPDLSLWAFICRPNGSVLDRLELTTLALRPHERLIAAAGARPLGLELPQAKVTQVAPPTLPEDWRGYSSIDALVWTGADPNTFQSSAQIDALRKWISCGGRWIFDRSSVPLLLQSPLADLVQVETGRTREVAALESLGAVLGSDLKGPAIIVEAVPRRGIVLARHEDHPLVVDTAHDGGRVTFLAFDPSLDPFATPENGGLLWKWLLEWTPRPVAKDPRPSPVRTAVGSDGLLSLLASFPGVAVPELHRLFLFIFIFLAVAGPVDYLILRRIRRLRLTWITFPSYIVILCLAIVVSGAGFMRNLVMQREIAVVDHYERSKLQRRRALEAILTPTDMTLASKGAVPLTSDFIFSGPSTSLEDLSDLTFRWDREMGFRDWTISRGATALALADDCLEAPSRLTWTSDDALIVVENDTGAAFSRATLFTPEGAFSVGDLPPGNSRRVRVPIQALQLPASSNQEENHFADVQRLLELLTFPPRDARPVTGFAGDLDARRWIKSGGSILIAWSRSLDPPVSFDPAPAHKRSLVMHRYYQERKP